MSDQSASTEPRRSPQGVAEVLPHLALAGALTVGVKAFPRLVLPFPMNILRAFITVGTAPTGAALIVDLQRTRVSDGTTQNLYGTTIANRPTIPIGATSSVTTSGVSPNLAAVLPPAPDVTALATGDLLLINVIQVGSTVAGSDLCVWLHAEKA